MSTQVSAKLPARTTTGIVLFVLCSLLSTLRIVWSAPNPARPAVDDIYSRSDQRFAVLKTRLPLRGVVGYIGESGDSATPDYYLTQYALAPLVVERSSAHSFVVGNFPSLSPKGIPLNLRLVEDFGNGVLLFANEGPR